MPPRSALARLLQFTTILTTLAALAWFVSHARERPLAAVLGALAIFFWYSFFLAFEFVLLRVVMRGDPVPMPTPGQLVRAWWAETFDALRAFYWRQPFRWREEPDFLDASVRGKRGVVFLHGFICNRGVWTPWLRKVREQGHGFAAVNLEPVFGSIDACTPLVEDAVQRVTTATGLAPILVGHSMGGLVARAWLRSAGAGGAGRVHEVVTLGTPHQGTWLARFSHLANGRQMRRHGEWLRRLVEDESARRLPPFTCWYANCDNIVFPPTTATLPHADNRLAEGAAHLDLAFRPEVERDILARLNG